MIPLTALALAHSPHDVARFVATAADGAVLSADTELLAWSTDGGATFRFRYLEAGEPVCGVAWDAGRWAAAAEDGGVWATVDGGLTLVAVDGPAHPRACATAGGTAWIAGDEGVWTATSPESWSPLPELPGAVADLAAGDALVALTDPAALFRLDGEAWTLLPDPPLRARQVALDGAAPVVATVDGALFRLDGDAWAEVTGSPLDIRTLAIEGDRWAAATADEGVWQSEDGGATWALHAEGFDRLASGPGSPADGVHFLDTELRDGVAWSAQWEGLWSRSPDATRWAQASLDVIPRVRTVAPLDDGTVLVGAYGGGVYRGTPGTTDWALVSAGVGWPYPKQVLALDADRWLVVSGSALYRTTDGGESWDEAPLPVDEVGDHVAAAGELVLAGVRDDEHAGVARSVDGGETWTVAALPGACDEKPAALETDGTVAWLACGSIGELYRSADGGAGWTLTARLERNVRDLLLAETLWLATEDGVWTTADGTGFTAVALAGEAVDRVLAGGDGTVWVASPTRGLGRLEDGAFVGVGWPTLDRLEDVAWADDGALVAGTRTGAWWSADAGGTWARTSGFDWADDAIQLWWFDDAWQHVDDADAAGGAVRLGTAGAVAELDAVAEQVRVVGSSPEGARFTLTVDGAAPVTVEVPEKTLTTELWAADLGPGPHRIGLAVEGGRLRVDGAVLWREGAPPLPADEPDTADAGTPPPPDGGCGCGGGGGGALVVLGALWPRRRR